MTVFGGIGHLLVTPCLSAQQTHTGTPFSGSGSAYASMGSISVDAPSMSQELYSSCTKSNGIDFIFGVPQILTLSLGASASGQRGYENAYAQFEGRFLFRDQSLNNISGATFVLSPVAVPEPGTFLLLILAAIPAMQWRRMR